MTSSKESFGRLIRSLRQAKDLGLRELARRAGMSATYLSKIESGDFDPPAFKKMNALARELGVEPDRLYAAAGKVPQDVEQMIEREPEKAMLLLRKAKDISVEDLMQYIEEKRRENKRAD